MSILLMAIGHISGSLDDPDLWWHITIGRWIIAHRDVPMVDYWTLFGAGQLWRAYSWSIEILFALTERLGGIQGLMALKLCVIGVLGFSAQYVFNRLSRSLGFGTLLAVFYVASVYNHLTLRPQTIIWIIFIWLLYAAQQISINGLTRRTLLPVFILMALWANIHLSAVLGLSLLFCWIVGRGRLGDALIAVGTGFAGTLITPYFGGEWLTLAQTSAHPFQFAAIAEFHPATILQYSSAFPLFIVIVLAMTIAHRPSLQTPMRWLLGAVFLIGALAVIKFMPFAMIILCGLFAAIWGEFDRKESFALFEGIERVIKRIESLPREGFSFVFICFATVNLYQSFGHILQSDVTPTTALDFIQQHDLPAPLLNSFGQGGYVMYRFSDSNGELRQRPSIDGRTNLISKELWKMHIDALEGNYGWQEYLDLVKPKTILWKAESPLTSILRNDSQWCHVFLAGTFEAGQVVFLAREEFDTRRSTLKADNCP